MKDKRPVATDHNGEPLVYGQEYRIYDLIRIDGGSLDALTAHHKPQRGVPRTGGFDRDFALSIIIEDSILFDLGGTHA